MAGPTLEKLLQDLDVDPSSEATGAKLFQVLVDQIISDWLLAKITGGEASHKLDEVRDLFALGMENTNQYHLTKTLRHQIEQAQALVQEKPEREYLSLSEGLTRSGLIQPE